MKNTIKKIMAAILTVAMATVIFAGCSGTDSSKKEIFIGASGPLTGGASSYGISVNEGAMLAVKEINAAGGVNGITFKYEMKDDKAAAADAASAYDALADAGMQISIGSVTSGSAEAFAERAAKDNLFFITPSASAPTVIAKGDSIFRVCFGDPDQGVLAAEELTANYTTIGCIYDTSDTYSSGIYEAFDAKMAELGVAYTTKTFDADTKTDFTAQVEALKDCDVIFLPIYYGEAGLIARACAAKGLDSIVLFGCDGLDGVAAEIDRSIVKNKISYITPFDVTAATGVAGAFITAYKAEYNREPDQFAADGYDAVYAIVNAIKAADVKDAGISASDLCEKVKSVILSDSFTLDGATGVMKWEASGACVKTPIIVEVK